VLKEEHEVVCEPGKENVSRDAPPQPNRNRGTSAASSATRRIVIGHHPPPVQQLLCTFFSLTLKHNDILRLYECASEPVSGVFDRYRRTCRDTHRHAILLAHSCGAAHLDVWAILEVFDVAGKIHILVSWEHGRRMVVKAEVRTEC
jgi:hypothetical protein